VRLSYACPACASVVNNTRGYREAELPSLEFEPEDGPALEQLINDYPKFTKVSSQC
jgi:hypothetical protein